MSHMDETRKDLAGKLEELEKKVTDTVGSVTDLVEKVPETVETVKETIAETVSTVTDTVQHTVDAVKGTVEGTVDAVEGAVASTVTSVRHFFDIPRQVDRHPWLMLGGSVVLGFLGGRFLLPRRAPAALPPPSPEPAPPPAYAPPAQTYEPARTQEPPYESEVEPEAREGFLSRLGDKFGDEITKVKGLALGTLLGVARDMVAQWVPDTLKQDVKSVINNFTSDLGGKVFEEPILGGNGQSAESGQEGHGRAQGDGSDQPERQEPHAATTATTTTAPKGGRGKR